MVWCFRPECLPNRFDFVKDNSQIRLAVSASIHHEVLNLFKGLVYVGEPGRITSLTGFRLERLSAAMDSLSSRRLSIG